MNKRQYKKHKKNILIKPLQWLIILVLLLVIVVILKNLVKSIQNERNISKEVKALQADVDKFNKENDDLNKLVAYLKSVDFQEREIKDKLNFINEGEKVVLIHGQNKADNFSNKDELEDNNVITTRAKYYYWWEYFFKKRSN
jgi:cell division protein FtsB